MKTLAPSLNLTMDMEELPLSVKPEQNVSLADMNRLLRETYEGTEWDMTKDMMVTKKIKDKDGTERDTIYKSPLAQNWMTNDMFEFLNAGRGEKKIEKQRTISVVRVCLFVCDPVPRLVTGRGWRRLLVVGR
ncbi:C69 family dipeptidase [Parabacteroides merdae]|nr:C69 family dipeptidase [Parabacteroides merdae]